MVLIPTRILIFIFALGVGISSSSAEPSVLSASGDLRFRTVNSKEDIDEARPFSQLRARLGLKAQPEESLALHFRLATGSSPISTNQVLGDSSAPGMVRRSFGVDLAFMEFIFWESGKFWAGRTANPLWSPGKNQLVFDGDIAFEGLAVKWEPKWSESSAFLNLGAYMVTESYDRPLNTADLGLAMAQLGYSVGGLTIHLNHYAFLNIQGRVITQVESTAKTDVYQGTAFDRYRGNTVFVNDPALPAADRKYYFTHQFEVSNAGFEYKTKFGQVDFLIFADYIKNIKVSDQGTGSEVGLQLKSGATFLQIASITKESDSTVATFTDSDSNGGGTDTQGTRVQLGYNFSKNSQISFSIFNAKRGVATVKRDFQSSFVDLIASF